MKINQHRDWNFIRWLCGENVPFPFFQDDPPEIPLVQISRENLFEKALNNFAKNKKIDSIQKVDKDARAEFKHAYDDDAQRRAEDLACEPNDL